MPKGGEFDVVVYGASGYTGRLVAEYMASRFGSGSGVAWAMAGRNVEKLAEVRREIGVPEVELISASGEDSESLRRMAARAKVVLTTVGPYQLYGSDLVAACAETGAGYVDLCGEPAWMRAMIDAHEATAKASGARIVFSCGFDSIPFDCGVFYLQQQAQSRFGGPCGTVRGRVRQMVGTYSGGTAASLRATLEAASRDPSLFGLLASPFALTPGFEGPPQPDLMSVREDASLGVWLAPFIMAPINTKNVHRANALLGHPWGHDFVYDEMLVTGPGEKGKVIAEAVAGDRSMMRGDGPKPGEGPSRQEREAGSYNLLFCGENAAGQALKVGVLGDRDPGYGSTSKMISEAAVCLAQDLEATQTGGIYTACAAMGAPLIQRLQAHAGLTFRVEQ